MCLHRVPSLMEETTPFPGGTVIWSFCFFIIFSKMELTLDDIGHDIPHLPCRFTLLFSNQNNPASNRLPQECHLSQLSNPSEVLSQKLSLLCPFSWRRAWSGQEFQGQVQLLKAAARYPGKYIPMPEKPHIWHC